MHIAVWNDNDGRFSFSEGDIAPPGAIIISDDEHRSLFSAQATGSIIIRGADGRPIAINPETLVTLDQLRADRLAVLRTACNTAITGGYSSAALGAVHTYPSSFTDQQNMAASILSSLLPGLADGWNTPFWCADAAGVWDFRPHSAAQIQQAGSDGKAWVLACQRRIATLAAAVAALDSAEALQLIAW